MKISVVNARAIAEALTAGADQAMAEGKHEFEILGAVQSLDDSAREDMQLALDEAKAKSG